MKHQETITKPQRNPKPKPPTRQVGSLYQEPPPFISSAEWWDEGRPGQTLVLHDDATPAAPRHPFDLEERTARFGEAIVRFTKRIPREPSNNRLIDQLVGCGTSVGANYCEADERVSKKDFRLSISRCVKEAKETKFFLRMVAAAEPQLTAEARELYREAKQLHLIFAAIYRK